MGKRIRVVRVKEPAEEAANRLTHLLGVALSLGALWALLARAWPLADRSFLYANGAFGVSLCLLYTASFLYHSARNEKTKHRLKILDHAAIYLLIAGSYTPFMVNVLGGSSGNTMLGVIWTLALCGVAFKLAFVKRFRLASTLVYLLMGWIVVVVVRPLFAALPPTSAAWLVAGGLSYSTGVIFYLLDRMRFNHAAWHVFVLGGSACHVMAVLYSMPSMPA